MPSHAPLPTHTRGGTANEEDQSMGGEMHTGRWPGRMIGDGRRAGVRCVTPVLAAAVGGAALSAVGRAHAQACDPFEVAKLLAQDAESLDLFGYAVSIDGQTAVVGAWRDDDNGSDSGSAYVFTNEEGVWNQQAKLLPADGDPGDQFGWSVAISGDTALVGAMGDEENGSASGSAYVFTRVGSAWTQQAKLLPSDGLTSDNFGNAVALDGDKAIIGAHYNDDFGSLSGSAYVFTRIADAWWVEQAKLLPADGARDDRFGCSVSIDNDTAIVGAWHDDDLGEDSGSAYVFHGVGGVWTQQAKLLPAAGAAADEFGWSVSISGSTALVGAVHSDANGSGAGAAYVFTGGDGVWIEQARLLASDGAAGDNFGRSVCVSGETALIGAWNDSDNGSDSGSAYVFMRIGGLWWVELAKILPADGAYGDHFGGSVAISAESILVGAYHNDDSGAASGSAYVFDLGCDLCPPDFNGDGLVDTRDMIGFLGAWSADDPRADWNGDGVINTLDFLAFLSDWSAGCP